MQQNKQDKIAKVAAAAQCSADLAQTALILNGWSLRKAATYIANVRQAAVPAGCPLQIGTRYAQSWPFQRGDGSRIVFRTVSRVTELLGHRAESLCEAVEIIEGEWIDGVDSAPVVGAYGGISTNPALFGGRIQILS